VANNFDFYLTRFSLLLNTDERFSEQFNLFPNPASDKISFTFPEILNEVNVIVTDIYGKKVLDEYFEKTDWMNIEVGNLNSGVYLANVFGNSWMVRRKFIISR
jgi:hypothetical protein